jgi:hypothetical protein
MSDITIFVAVFLGFFVLRAIAATILFYFLLPEGNRCPLCDEPTIRVRDPGWNLLLPWFRTSWCYCCGWEGLLRRGTVDEPASTDSHSGQLPLSSKKSSS